MYTGIAVLDRTAIYKCFGDRYGGKMFCAFCGEEIKDGSAFFLRENLCDIPFLRKIFCATVAQRFDS